MTIPTILSDMGARALMRLDPETAHTATVAMLARGLGPRYRQTPAQRNALETVAAGLTFPNVLGLAAGFDKNAEAVSGSLRLGFGFVEVGAVTPRPQSGNARPRVFRLREDQAVINRYGFNNDGLDVVAARLRRRGGKAGIVGGNLGANKDSDDRAEDYVLGLQGLNGLVDFYTVNISSPNTPGLRALQGKAALDDLLAGIVSARAALANPAPVFLKIAPDLQDEDKADIVATVKDAGIDGLIVSNTTIERPAGLKGAAVKEKGGLSGAPLFAPSTALLREMRQAIGPDMTLIGVGGVDSAAAAYAKIRAGANLVQLYTGLVYEGPGLVRRILRGLPRLLQADGFANVCEAVGVDA